MLLAWQLPSVNLLPALVVAVPAAFVLSLLGISAARRARFKVDRSVFRAGDRTARLGQFLVWAGLYFAVVGGAGARLLRRHSFSELRLRREGGVR